MNKYAIRRIKGAKKKDKEETQDKNKKRTQEKKHGVKAREKTKPLSINF